MQDDNETANPGEAPSPPRIRHRLSRIPHRLSRIPHRLSTALAGRLAALVAEHRRALALGSAALAVAGLAAAGSAIDIAGSAAVTAGSVGQANAERESADRADRSGRTGSSEPQSPAPTAAASSPPATTPPSPPAAPPKPKPAWVNPMPGAQVTSCYGPRWGTLHQGVDFAAPPSTPVRAIGAGVVVGAGWIYGGYGISVMIDHGNGYRTHYAHLKFTNVAPGQRVTADQMIGAEGSTGDSTGPHLHFEVHRGVWNQVEPVSWLRARGVRVPAC